MHVHDPSEFSSTHLDEGHGEDDRERQRNAGCASSACLDGEDMLIM